jgi:hypothetical protein
MTSAFTYDIVPFQILILFVSCKFFLKKIITCIRGTIKILNVLVFILSTLYLCIFEYKISNLNVRLIVLFHINVMFHFLGWSTHTLFELFVWINTLPSV